MLWHRLAVNVSSKSPLSSVESDEIRTQEPSEKKKQQQETKNKKMKKIKCEKLLEIGLAAVKLDFEDEIKAKEQCGQKN